LSFFATLDTFFSGISILGSEAQSLSYSSGLGIIFPLRHALPIYLFIVFLGTVARISRVESVESVGDAPIGKKLAIEIDYLKSVIFKLQEIVLHLPEILNDGEIEMVLEAS
jgi:hypothetical protein